MCNPAFDISKVFGSSVDQIFNSNPAQSPVATSQNMMTRMHATDLFIFRGFETLPPLLRTIVLTNYLSRFPYLLF